MREMMLRGLDGNDAAIPGSGLQALDGGMRGNLLTPASADYDAARAVWNAMIDRRPGLIARCAGPADVAAAVRFARAHDLLLAVRGGGHNIAGNAACDGGMVIDLSAMRSVRVDPAGRTARVEPGCTLRDVDHEAQASGLATPLGINSTTGIAGLTLGGGFGWLSRRHGLTVDNLLSADVVTAAGERVTASATHNPDLFWGIRGGGGNFGVVTSFEFRLHAVGPTILSGLIVHPFEDARDVLRYYREFTAGAPDDLVVWAVLRKAPPLPFLPAEWHGREVVILAVFWAGADHAAGERALAPLRAHGRPIADVTGPHPYAGWQQAFDPLLTPGARNYWKSHDFTSLSDGALDAIIDYAGRLPGPQCEIFVAQLGGAINRIPATATAYPHRDIEYVLNVHTRWDDPGEDERCVSWARSFFDATAPHATGGVYVNFMPADESGRVPYAYGPNLERLSALKRKYDPDNAFRLNQNIGIT